MREKNLKEGTARSRNTNDSRHGHDVDVLTYDKEVHLRVNNFMNRGFRIPTDWKRDLDHKLWDATPTGDQEQKKLFMHAVILLTNEAIVESNSEHIEEQIVEILDVAERLIKSMVMQYATEHRALVEKYAQYLLENPDKADVVIDNLKALKR